MPKGIGMDWKGYPSKGIHLSTGSEYPDSPCGSGGPFVRRIEDVTCPACLAIIAKGGNKAQSRLDSLENKGWPTSMGAHTCTTPLSA